jgi:hypothetical protein
MGKASDKSAVPPSGIRGNQQSHNKHPQNLEERYVAIMAAVVSVASFYMSAYTDPVSRQLALHATLSTCAASIPIYLGIRFQIPRLLATTLISLLAAILTWKIWQA